MCYTVVPSMNIIQCSHCKVRYERESITCPVCHYSAEEPTTKAVPKGQGKRATLIISFILFFIPCTVALAVDAIYTEAITWSLVVIVAFVFTWIYIFLTLFFYRFPWRFFMLYAINTMLFLFSLDFVTGQNWFFFSGLVIAGVWIILIGLTIFVITKLGLRGWNIAGFIILAIAIGLVFTEGFISFVTTETITVQWSLITFGAMVPVACVLFYMHKKREWFSRWFYI